MSVQWGVCARSCGLSCSLDVVGLAVVKGPPVHLVRADFYGFHVDLYGVRYGPYEVRVDLYGVRVDLYGVRVDLYGVRVDLCGVPCVADVVRACFCDRGSVCGEFRYG